MPGLDQFNFHCLLPHGGFATNGHGNIKHGTWLKKCNIFKYMIGAIALLGATLISGDPQGLSAVARPAVEVIRDTAGCVAGYDAAHKVAELMGNRSAIDQFAREGDRWRTLLAALVQLATANEDTRAAQDIRNSIATVYKRQFERVVRSIAENQEIVFHQIHRKCKEIAKEVRNAAGIPFD